MTTPDQARILYPIMSEEFEPFAMMMIGKMFARAEAVKDDEEARYEALRSLWWTMKELNRLTILASTTTYSSIAIMNRMRVTRSLIEAELKIDVDNEPGWKWAWR